MKFIPIPLEQGEVGYINPEFVASIVPNKGASNLFMVGDENPYAVNESAEQLANRISSGSEDVALAPTPEPKVAGVPDYDRLG